MKCIRNTNIITNRDVETTTAKKIAHVPVLLMINIFEVVQIELFEVLLKYFTRDITYSRCLLMIHRVDITKEG